MSATAIAEALGVSRATPGHWMRGRSRPKPAQIPRLAELLGMAPAELREVLAETVRRNSAD
jgi:transcriptional regulator with XRE-family HTH domain